jgi:hypothetical protein
MSTLETDKKKVRTRLMLLFKKVLYTLCMGSSSGYKLPFASACRTLAQVVNSFMCVVGTVSSTTGVNLFLNRRRRAYLDQVV